MNVFTIATNRFPVSLPPEPEHVSPPEKTSILPDFCRETCEHHYKRWCRAVPGKNINTAFLEACPDDPKVRRFGCRECEHFEVHRGNWCRYRPGHFTNIRGMRGCPR